MKRKTTDFMSILSDFLTKKQVEKVEDLSPEEKKTFENWKRILSGGEISVEKIQEFCKSQILVIESQCDGKTPLSMVQQASLHVYLNILKAITAPQAEKESLERHLVQIISEP